MAFTRLMKFFLLERDYFIIYIYLLLISFFFLFLCLFICLFILKKQIATISLVNSKIFDIKKNVDFKKKKKKIYCYLFYVLNFLIQKDIITN
jgi:hypothetical protein